MILKAFALLSFTFRPMVETAVTLCPEQTHPPSPPSRPSMYGQVISGARVPVDGVVEAGEAQLDESAVTGEALPVTKGEVPTHCS